MLRGFKNIFRTEYQVVNLEDLARLPESITDVTLEVMVGHRLVRSARKPVKVLGGGELARAMQVKAAKFSKSARSKIEAAGGGVEEA